MKRTAAPTFSLEEYRELLLAKRRALLSDLAQSPGFADPGRVAEDDQAPILHEQFISLHLKALDYQTLRQVNAALNRMDLGIYGECTECGEGISPKRLAAIPWADYCIDCQERVSREQTDLDDWAA